MAAKNEGQYTGDWLVAEFAPPAYCREKVTVVSGQNLKSGELVGKVTASGKYAQYLDGNSDGTEVAAGICYVNTDATAADKVAVIIARGPVVVSKAGLTGLDAAGQTDLEAIAPRFVFRDGV